jgi:teichoic acid transport system permease protein
MSAPPASQPTHHSTNEWALERHVYEPHVVGLPPVGQYLREVWRRRAFAFELARTNLRAQHFDTAFGVLWLVLNPLLLACVYFVLVDIIRRGHKPPDYFSHLVVCIFAYYMVSGAVRDSVKSVVKGGKLILNSAFPRMLLPLSSVVVAFRRFVPTAIVYVPLHVLSGRPVTWNLLWVPALIVLFLMVATGFGLLVAAAQVYFRDLASFLPYVLRVTLYTAPILYTADRVPNGYTFLLNINPIARLLAAWNNVIHVGVGPGTVNLAIGAAWACAAMVVGLLFFLSRERDFAVRI